MKRLEGRPFALLGVNLGRLQPRQLAKVMEDEKLSWRSFADRGEIQRLWCMPGTPTLYLIDAEGVIRHKWLGVASEAAMDGAIDRLVRAAEGAGRPASRR